MVVPLLYVCDSLLRNTAEGLSCLNTNLEQAPIGDDGIFDYPVFFGPINEVAIRQLPPHKKHHGQKVMMVITLPPATSRLCGEAA